MVEDSKKFSEFIEEAGVLFEYFGTTRMIGRIFGWMVVCRPPHQSAKEIAEALDASAGSISTSLRVLQQIGFIEKIGIPGDRSSYYRIDGDALGKVLLNKSKGIEQLVELAEKGISLAENYTEEEKRRLTEMRDIYAWFSREFPKFLQSYFELKKEEGNIK
mgnify:CR=1 FL=1